MFESKVESKKTSRSTTQLIILGVLIILLGVSAFFYIRYQRAQPKTSGSAVYVPDLLRPENTNFEYYKTKIHFEDVKAGLGINYNNTRVAMISGTILNDGDRKLEALELRVTLYDMWGKVSKERTAFAVRPGTGLGAKPMAPLERRSFTISIEGIEYYWNPNEVVLEITGLKYQ